MGVSLGSAKVASHGTAATLLRLTHAGWERRADGARARLGYDSGREPVLGALAAAAP